MLVDHSVNPLGEVQVKVLKAEKKNQYPEFFFHFHLKGNSGPLGKSGPVQSTCQLMAGWPLQEMVLYGRLSIVLYYWQVGHSEVVVAR